jgi:hypothetical protein
MGRHYHSRHINIYILRHTKFLKYISQLTSTQLSLSYYTNLLQHYYLASFLKLQTKQPFSHQFLESIYIQMRDHQNHLYKKCLQLPLYFNIFQSYYFIYSLTQKIFFKLNIYNFINIIPKAIYVKYILYNTYLCEVLRSQSYRVMCTFLLFLQTA